MTEHVLKTLPDYWDAVDRGDKTFEVRRDDRGFQKGDTLILCKLHRENLNTFESTTGWHTDEYKRAKMLVRRVKYVLTGGQLGIEPGYVVMALRR